MKKRNIVVIGGVLLLATIAVFASVYFFPLTEKDLTEAALKRATQSYDRSISGYTVLDSKSGNLNRAFIYRFELEDGTQTSYAVAYCKHFLFARYRFTSYADYTRSDFSGILIATGMPYDTVYDITEYSLKYKDSALNYNLVIMIRVLITTALLTVIISAKRIYRWFVKLHNKP